jgi:hypothetical protein
MNFYPDADADIATVTPSLLQKQSRNLPVLRNRRGYADSIHNDVGASLRQLGRSMDLLE